MSTTIQYPPTSPTTTVVLRSPVLGDTTSTEIQTNLKIMMTGDTVATRRTPAVQTLRLQFKGICQTDTPAIKTFLQTVLGRDVRLTMPNGDMWIGKILTNPFEITHDHRDAFLLELVGTFIPVDSLLSLEDGSGFLLLEDGGYLLLEDIR